MFKRVDTKGKPVHTDAMFQVSVRGFELPVYAPRTDVLYVECTQTVVKFLVEQTISDLEHLPDTPLEQDKPVGAPNAPLKEEKPEDAMEEQPNPSDLHEEVPAEPPQDPHMVDVRAIIADLQGSEEVSASWYPSRNSFVVTIGNISKQFLAPHFRLACGSGDAQPSLAAAHSAAMAWLEGQKK